MSWERKTRRIYRAGDRGAIGTRRATPALVMGRSGRFLIKARAPGWGDLTCQYDGKRQKKKTPTSWVRPRAVPSRSHLASPLGGSLRSLPVSQRPL